jgi:hypothetical protein
MNNMIAAIMAIFKNKWTKYPTINPTTNIIIIIAIGGKPPMLPEVIK